MAQHQTNSGSHVLFINICFNKHTYLRVHIARPKGSCFFKYASSRQLVDVLEDQVEVGCLALVFGGLNGLQIIAKDDTSFRWTNNSKSSICIVGYSEHLALSR